MRAALDTLIQNGAGGRMVIILRQLCELSDGLDGAADDTLSIVDEIMAGAAVDLEPDTAAMLADSSSATAERLPLFTETLRQMAGIAMQPDDVRRPVEAIDMFAPVEIAAEDCNATDLADAAAEAMTVAGELDVEPSVIERRVVARLPAPPSPEDDVIGLARNASVDELMSIAQLPHLPEALTNVIVARGEREVIVTALRNENANFAKSSLTTLVELAASDRLLRDAMIRRADLPEAIVDRLLPFLPSEDRARAILGGAPFSEEHVTIELAAATAELITEVRDEEPFLGVESCLALLEDGSVGIDTLVGRLADDARGAELSSVLAERLGVSTTTIYNALMGRLDQASAVVLRAAEAGPQAIDAVMALRRRCGCRPAREFRGAVHHYESYSVEDARRLVGLMDGLIGTMAQPELPQVLPEADHAAIAA
jgi:hypothetical protein